MKVEQAGAILAVAAVLAGCSGQQDPEARMRAWVQAQKAEPAKAPEPWPDAAIEAEVGVAGQDGAAKAQALHDPFAAVQALGGISDPASAAFPAGAAGAGGQAGTAGPVYLGMLQRGADRAAVVRTGESVELVRIGQRIGKDGARVAGIGTQALTLHAAGASGRDAKGTAVQQLPLEQDGMQ